MLTQLRQQLPVSQRCDRGGRRTGGRARARGSPILCWRSRAPRLRWLDHGAQAPAGTLAQLVLEQVADVLDEQRAHLLAAAAAAQPGDAEPADGGLSWLEPTYLELGFGFGDDDQPGEPRGLPELDLGDGVMLRGRIDRVDVGGRGEAVVYDYKGRSVSPGAKWGALGELQVALYMRAVEALLGLRVVGGFYQPLTGSDLRPRGVLDGDAGVEGDSVRADRRTAAEVRALVAEAVASARRAAAEAGRGELRARPRTCAFKGGCRYPTICRRERR